MKNKTKQFIEKAIEGGWKPNYSLQGNLSNSVFAEYLELHFGYRILLDPLAWQAVGKVEGWTTVKKEHRNFGITLAEMDEWYFNMHRMIDALAEASQKPNFDMQKTIQEFLETL